MWLGVVILAAGSSSRLGQPKQLLELNGETLLRRTVRVAVEAGADPIVVVLGANAERLREHLHDTNAQVVYCDRWAGGMGASLATGIGALSNDVDAALVLLCDQPLVDSTHLTAMREQAEVSEALIIAASYGETLGVPCLFRRVLFPELQQLQGDKGARFLIRQHRDQTEPFPFPEAATDIDTLADYAQLTKNA